MTISEAILEADQNACDVHLINSRAEFTPKKTNICFSYHMKWREEGNANGLWSKAFIIIFGIVIVSPTSSTMILLKYQCESATGCSHWKKEKEKRKHQNYKSKISLDVYVWCGWYAINKWLQWFIWPFAFTATTTKEFAVIQVSL